MFGIFDLDIYTYPLVYNSVVLIACVLLCLNMRVVGLDHPRNLAFARNLNIFALLFTIVYIGCRPLIDIFYDMQAYARQYLDVQAGASAEFKDLIYGLFLMLSAKFVSVNDFFFLLALIYIIPTYVAIKKWGGDYAPYLFIAVLSSFLFLNYGVNTMRSGVAGALFLLALSRDNKKYKYLLFLMAVGFHKSALLIVAVYFIVTLIPKVSLYMKIWFFAFLVSFLFGDIFNQVVLDVEFLHDRSVHYLSIDNEFGVYETGFRWDFILYSVIFIVYGWYFIFRKKFKDKLYELFYSMFLLANAFWILIVRVPYSDRFAYLSWFLVPIIVIYPLLKKDVNVNRAKWLRNALFLMFAFTFFMVLK